MHNFTLQQMRATMLRCYDRKRNRHRSSTLLLKYCLTGGVVVSKSTNQKPCTVAGTPFVFYDSIPSIPTALDYTMIVPTGHGIEHLVALQFFVKAGFWTRHRASRLRIITYHRYTVAIARNFAQQGTRIVTIVNLCA